MNRKTLWTVVAGAVVGLCLPLAGWAAEGEGPAKAPAFTLADQNGNKVSLSDFAGKIVVLEWMNWGCPVSMRFAKAGEMNALAEKYKDKGVVWLGIDSSSFATQEANKKGVEQYKLSYPVLDDHGGEVGHAYDAKSTPDMRIIGKDGAGVYEGAIDNDPGGKKEEGTVNYVAQALDELLAGKPVSTPKTKPYGCSVKYGK